MKGKKVYFSYTLACRMFFRKKNSLPPNFLSLLKFSSPWTELEVGSFFLFLFLCILFVFPFQEAQSLGIFLLGGVFLLALLLKIEWGVYALGIFSFFHGWEIAFAQYNFTRNIALLNALNAPVVDFISAFLLVFMGLGFLFRILKKQVSFEHLRWPALWYGGFLLVSLWSATHAWIIGTGDSLRAVGRPLIFLFACFIFLPHLCIQNERVLHRFLKLWFWVGVGIALFGLSSLFVVQSSGWVRIQPYGIGSFAPLGVNHNLIAEVLVAIVPIGIWLMWEQRKKEKSEAGRFKLSISLIGTGLMFLVGLGTLSRAAWITFAVEAVALFFLFREQGKILLNKVRHLVVPLALLACVGLAYMGIFLTSSVVSSSDVSRLEVTKMVIFYATRAPVFGYGPGSFIPVLSDTFVHIVEFGDPLDAHGFIQKVVLEEGFLGLAFFILFLLSILVILFRTQKQNTDVLSKVLFLMCLGAITFQLFNTSYFNSVMWLPLGIALTSVGILKKKN